MVSSFDSIKSIEASAEQYSVCYYFHEISELFTLNMPIAEAIEWSTRQIDQERRKQQQQKAEGEGEGEGESKESIPLMAKAVYNHAVNTIKESIDREKGSIVNNIDKIFFRNRSEDYMSPVLNELSKIRGSLTNRQPTKETIRQGIIRLEKLK